VKTNLQIRKNERRPRVEKDRSGVREERRSYSRRTITILFTEKSASQAQIPTVVSPPHRKRHSRAA